MGFDVRRIKRRTVPICQPGLFSLRLKNLQQSLPYAVTRPAYESVVAGLPRTVSCWNIAPRRTRPQTPQDTVDHPPMVNIGMPTMRVRRQMRGKLPPLLFS